MAIVRIALPVAINQLFDYWLPAGLAIEPGSVLRVRLARRRLLGVALELTDTTPIAPERLAPVEEIVTTLPALPEELRTLGRFVSDYYQQPIGQCLAQMLPPLGARGGAREPLAARYRLTPEASVALADLDAKRGARWRQLRDWLGAPEGAATAELRRCGPQAWRTFAAWRRARLVEAVAPPLTASVAPPTALNADQRRALAAALPEPWAFAPSLLQGVTGSGKTEIYFAAAAQTIAAGRQALVLVPEINLTPQLEARFAAALPGVAMVVLHSALPAGVRLARWLAAARGEVQLVVGTRLNYVLGYAQPPRFRASASSSSTRNTMRRSSSRTACATMRATSPFTGHGCAMCRSFSAAPHLRSKAIPGRESDATAG